MKEELKQLLEKISESYPEDKRHSLQKSIEGPLWKDDENGKKYLKLMGSFEEYSVFDNRLQTLGNSASATTLEQLVDWTLNRARIVGAERAINEIDTYVSSSEVDVDFVELVVGLSADCEYDFCNGVKLTDTNNIQNRELAIDLVSATFGIIPFPKVHTVLIHPFKQTIQHRSTTEPESPNWDMDSLAKAPNAMEDVVLCLSLVRPIEYGVHPIAYGCVAPDNLPFIHSLSGWSIIPYKHPPLAPPVLEIEFEQANRILSAFTQLNSNFKKKLKIPLSKLNAFGSGENHVDKAIDLRICLESIFLDEGNKDQLRYRLSLRAALFIGSTLEERKSIFKLIRDTYDITSTAVHNGKLSTNDDTDILKDAASIAKKALIKLIEDGAVNWVELELKN